jgi:gas vesicle protein
MIFGILAVGGLIGVVVAKFFATNRSQALRLTIVEVQSQNNKIKGELKIAGSMKAAAIQDLKIEERKLRTLKLKITKYDKNLRNLKK